MIKQPAIAVQPLDPSVIPPGGYCYSITEAPSAANGFRLKTRTCPYWSSDLQRDEQEGGYCSYLKRGDWEGPGLGLLWDQVKECGVNDATEDDLLP